MTTIAIIGGTGLTKLTNLAINSREVHVTAYGEPSAPLTRGTLAGKEVLFLPRHGAGHTIPPHKVNYRANIAVLKNAGVDKVIAVNAVGGITANMPPQALAVPDQIIDYTWSRDHTYFDEGLEEVVHIDFTQPYCASLRADIIKAAERAGVAIEPEATYAATQGPRLETSAEVNRLERDGCHIVGMTGMPEAALAKELGLCYASIAVVANWAAGRSEGEITLEEIERHLGVGIEKVKHVLEALIPAL
ncbi:MAG: S-methyl-5'-thioinosine phosphorylase [Gammaproteobacteria bacterium]|nr:S-methyl-5'-thioinosine phosphorylase [Gammaproteobacteria bacterium]